MYAVIDIETTGGSPRVNKITEIAVFIFDGLKITDEFSTLINPECMIPEYITRLTGISNEMVADAPKFYEVAKKIVEITENQLFVAHNSAFDYGFIREEFKRLGYNYYRQQLDTVKLSRKLIPARKSYSLGNLCNELNIEITNRHRAAGDARATVELLSLLLKINDNNQALVNQVQSISTKGLHPDFDPETIKKLPEDPGVYYFLNDRQDIIYIGKSKNIQQRVKSHFVNNSSKRAFDMRSNTVHIAFETTGSELVALLKESAEIKKHKPLYNRLQRRTMQHYGIYTSFDTHGYRCFEINATRNQPGMPITCFNNKKEAEKQLLGFVEKFDLCQKLSGLYKNAGACFYHGIGECKGACIQSEPVNIYNDRAIKVLHYYNYVYQNFVVLDSGRTQDEKSFILIQNGKYMGFGFIPTDEAVYTTDQFADYIEYQEDNAEIQRIITGYLKNNTVERIIRF